MSESLEPQGLLGCLRLGRLQPMDLTALSQPPPTTAYYQAVYFRSLENKASGVAYATPAEVRISRLIDVQASMLHSKPKAAKATGNKL